MRIHSWLAALLAIAPGPIWTAPASAAEPVDFLRQIKPLLADRCFVCHGPLNQKARLRLDTVAAMRRGGRSGPAVIPNKPADSVLLDAVTGQGRVRMPPEGEASPLSETQVALLRTWIEQGAHGPDNEQPLEDPRKHWSYRPVQRPTVPQVKDPDWNRNPIDAFLAAEHAKRGLTPRQPADKDVLLRRVYLDLIGLPPTREEQRAFLADTNPDAYEKVVDKLLASPQYGERWGRHWMDVWRYADWYGSRAINEVRYSQRHIWRWRDWIVESLNADKGYDQMLREMLAGDEIAPADPNTLRATGFLGRNWYKFDRNVWMFETVEQTSQAFLGLTMRCARCHDHKYDPITQRDYYRFRAFFEPHDVRTDRLSLTTATEKDATLGQVLKDGVARVYDKQLDAPTYRFIRGDDRHPDKSEVLLPGVPAVFGNDGLAIQAVSLPPEAFYQALQPHLHAELLDQAVRKIATARAAVVKAREEVAALQTKVDAAASGAGKTNPSTEPTVFLSDNFARARPEVWKILDGQWSYENGRLIEKQVAVFATLVSQKDHPRDFQARVRYRTLQPGTYRSVGFSFDFLDKGNSQDIYTSTGDGAQSVQAFHRFDGQQFYPAAGIVPAKLKVGDVTTVEIKVRDNHLTIHLNGEHKLAYVLPVPRRAGKFALWVHAGAAEFLDVDIRALVESPEDLKQHLRSLQGQVVQKEKQVAIEEAELASFKARTAAEKAKYALPADPKAAELALAAGKAERAVAVARAELELLQAEQTLAETRRGPAGPAVGAAEGKVKAQQDKLAAARAAWEKPSGEYQPLGEMLPRTSTGRRLALARWLTSLNNPRTARVAVNHLWLRHFGQALVPTVANFGVNGKPPTHPELLDCLASELTSHSWSMKHLHRLMVTSRAYRMTSSPLDAKQNLAVDPDNRYLWRMNSRRMEAEVVRDSLLYLAGRLDLARGGPELDENRSHEILRRSLYFRITPNERVVFLDLFDLANPNQCYERQTSVVPQQALALMNSALSIEQSRLLSQKLSAETGPGPDRDDNFVRSAFDCILNRPPSETERAACRRFLAQQVELLQKPEKLNALPPGDPVKVPPAANPRLRARENLVQVLFEHNDFVTIR
jgi:hypothetical protein